MFTFRPGGVYGERFLVEGYAGTATGDEQSVKRFRAFTRNLRKGFVRVKAWHVGPGALALMNSGYRLTLSIQTPETFDLRAG